MALLKDVRVLYHLLSGARGRGATHAERLESFYGGQSECYDDFRERLLHGRREMFAGLPHACGQVWVDMGAGTGRNLEFVPQAVARKKRIYLVDLSPSLLAVAERRLAARRWDHVRAVNADVCRFMPEEGAGQVDLVTFSYSLTMIPAWHRALRHAAALLRPGGAIGVVDFYVSGKHPPAGRCRHGWLTRHGCRAWFEHDNVFLSPDHIAVLHDFFDACEFREARGSIPYLPGVRVPYYVFIGTKP